MGKSGKIAILGSAVLLLVALLYFFGFKKSETEIIDDWYLSYNPDSKEPYGTYALKELLDTTGLFGNFLQLNEKLEDNLEDDPGINDIYFFVGGKNYLSDSSANYLMDFVRKGNTAFISTEDFPLPLIEKLTDYEDKIIGEYGWDTTQFLKFEHSNLKTKRYQFDYILKNKKAKKSWKYFDLELFQLDYPEDLTVLGTNTKEKSNFIRLKYGEGQLFLHSIPYCFTNIAIFKRDGFQYAENVLKHIPPGRVQWDRYNIEYHRKNTNRSGDQEGVKHKSVLQFIMANPPLLWAFLILLVGAVLYAVFKGKRMQKIIPSTEAKTNLSLQYINTLSSLYLQEKKHNKLIKLKEKTFLNFIANRYYIHSYKPDERFIQKLAVKSHFEVKWLTDLFELFRTLEMKFEVTDTELIDLHKRIEHFYKNCR